MEEILASTPRGQAALSAHGATSPTRALTNYPADGSTQQQQSVTDLTRRLNQREAEIRLWKGHSPVQYNQSAGGGGVTIGAEAYDTLLAHYMEREE